MINLETLKAELENKEGITSLEFFRNYESLNLGIDKNNVISFSSKINTDEFKSVIKASIHHSRNVERMNEKGKYIIRKLFKAYYMHPQQLPDGQILHFLVDIDSYF